MDLFQAIVLGLLQGITEWLPISSQGNVIIAGIKLFGLEAEQAFSYSVFLHLGTVLAALIYFRKDIKEIIEMKNKNLMQFLIIAVLSTAITAIPVYLLIKQFAVNSMYLTLLIGLMLIVTGFLQWKKKSEKEVKENSKNAFLLGLGQEFSVIPG